MDVVIINQVKQRAVMDNGKPAYAEGEEVSEVVR